MIGGDDMVAHHKAATLPDERAQRNDNHETIWPVFPKVVIVQTGGSECMTVGALMQYISKGRYIISMLGLSTQVQG